MNRHEIDSFIGRLKFYHLTSQQIRTLRGQALSGDLAGARMGLERIIKKAV